MRTVILATVLLIIPALDIFGQTVSSNTRPEIEGRVPYFKLTDVGNFRQKQLSSDNVQGRHVIFDFWNKNCISCVQSFPKLNQVHERYNDRLDLILVGTDEKGIHEMFASLKEKLKLTFPYAYNMSMYSAFVPAGAPHLVWIDDKGIVKAISSGSDLTAGNIEAFLRGKPFAFSDRSHSFFAQQDSAYTSSKPFLVRGNGGIDYESRFKYRSLIVEYIPGSPQRSWPDFNLWNQKFSTGRPDGNRRVFEVCTHLKELYTMAYIGWVQWAYGDAPYSSFHGRIILDLPDSSLFEYDSKNGSGQYWYSLIMPSEKATPSYVMESMQNDLKRYFGYSVSIESRRFPYLRLIASQRAKTLKTKGGTPSAQVDHSMFKASNIPLEDFLQSMLAYHNYWETEGRVPVIVNETEIDFNVDIDVKVNDGSWEDVQRCIKELGFDFVPDEKEFKVIVIRK